ncbi:MAG TPA: hypothetical protein VIP52_04595, partial [Candidatus Dormibacteraeota bacterium]
LEMIERKAEGQEMVIAEEEEEEEQAPVVDLMAALEASLAAAKRRPGDPSGSSAEDAVCISHPAGGAP